MPHFLVRVQLFYALGLLVLHLDPMNIAKLKSKAEGLVTQLTAKDACEKRVLDAIASHSYAAPRSLLNEIAEDTFSHERYRVQHDTEYMAAW